MSLKTKRRRAQRIEAAAMPSMIRLCAASEDFELQAAASGDGPKVRKFSMTAYTGEVMHVQGFYRPVVVDLSGLKAAGQAIAILRDHDPSQIVGHTDGVEITAQRVKLTGAISGIGAAAQEIQATADNGFPWQASIGAPVHKTEFIEAGSKVNVNGRSFTGPLVVIRAATLREVSFVALGADSGTSARVAATAAEESDMKFSEWLAAKGFEIEKLSAAQVASWQVVYDAEIKAAAKPAKGPDDEDDDGDDDAKALKAARKLRADETRRVEAVVKACAGKHPAIEAQAIEEGWSADKAELTVLRASRPAAPSPGGSGAGSLRGADDDVIRAAICQSLGIKDHEKGFKPETLQAAHTAFRGRISLQQLLLEAAWGGGYDGRHFDASDGGIRRILQAAFSTMSLPGIFADTMQKSLLAAFMGVEDTWQQISAIGSVKDFRTITRYRLSGDFEFEEVAPTGELQHGSVEEESFTNRAKTYGKMFAITRTDIINDDLGAMNAIPAMIGRGSALKLNKVFWTAFMDNASFFANASAGHNDNYYSGSTSNLSIDSLTVMEGLFLDQVDLNGDPLAIAPKILLHPNALNVTAAAVAGDLEIRDTTASTKYSIKNPHAGKFRTVRSSYLSNATITGYSTLAWYLLADPNDLPVIEVVFLNGNRTPIVESADADFNVLGVQMRGYFDFGVTKQDYRGGVKSKGEA